VDESKVTVSTSDRSFCHNFTQEQLLYFLKNEILVDVIDEMSDTNEHIATFDDKANMTICACEEFRIYEKNSDDANKVAELSAFNVQVSHDTQKDISDANKVTELSVTVENEFNVKPNFDENAQLLTCNYGFWCIIH
jgi:archaellin